MLTPQEFETAKTAVNLASMFIQTPSWKRKAKAMNEAMRAGQEPDAKDLDLILTVLKEGADNYTSSARDPMTKEYLHPDRRAIEAAVPVRDRIRKAA